ncbi:HDOD domain-containing protein [Marinomonas sp. THO17]|uniref:HDOD domain-containing protein n=1 Tax=Marinomonas sp. THO17 TaxID=3149048 RepID=UPI00336BF443
MRIEELIKQTDKLPNVPDVVRELIQLLGDPDANYSDISSKVAHDQTISLKVLRIVNSAYFGLSRKISSIDEATVLIGMEKLKTLVIASGFSASVESAEGVNLRDFWADSFQVAELAKWVAKRSNLVNEDEAFTVGIVHNIGVLLLHLTAPETALEIQTLVDNRKASRMKAEMDLLGFTTQQAGQALMDQWKFPANLGVAVKEHKRPFMNDNPQPLACVLNLACFLNACIRSEREIELVRESLPKAVVKAAGLGESVMFDLDEALQIGNELSPLIY